MSLNETYNMQKDGFAVQLHETQDMFKEKFATNIIGKDIESVLTENTLFSTYVDQLTEGFAPEKAEQITQLLENTRQEILTESSLTGIQPFYSLSMPMLVRLWARLTLTNALPTEPTKTPAFTVPMMKPYMLDAEGNKTYLPESINNGTSPIGLVAIPTTVALTTGKVTDYDLFTGLNAKLYNADLDTLDRKFAIKSVKYSDATDPVALVGASRLVLNGDSLHAKVTYTDTTDSAQEDTLIGHVNLEDHTLSLVSLSGKATEVEVEGFISSEQHTTSLQVSFEIDRKDINIGTAQHIEGSLPVEFLEDVNAMYSVDGASTITNHMSALAAQNIDLDIIAFLEKSYAATGAAYTKEFSVYPSAQFAMNPNDWLNGLQKTIDFIATSMRNDYKLYSGYYVIVGNPLDVDLLPNVDWTFRGVQDKLNGIDVDYNLGAVRASNHYKIISSDLIPQGELTVFMVPTQQDYKTYVYYPYTFNVVSNYLNTRNERVPSVMMTRRYTIEEFTPIIGKIVVKNNDGTVYARA